MNTVKQGMVRGGTIHVGTQLAEEDGFLWEVTEVIASTATSIRIRLNSDFSSDPKHWLGRAGVVKTLRKSDSYRGLHVGPIAMNWIETKKDLLEAILNRDVARLGQIADQMRFQGKLNYDQSYAVARELTGIDESDWDSILYEADEKDLER